MKKEDFFRRGFRLTSVIPATVCCIKDDRVRFRVKDVEGVETDAWYFLHGEKINPHQVFKRNETIEVTVMRICKDSKDDEKTIIEVRPLFLPVDFFVADHAIEEEVSGRIVKIHGSGMTVELAPNVHCQVKRFGGAVTGMNVFCALKRYNPNRKILFAAVL